MCIRDRSNGRHRYVAVTGGRHPEDRQKDTGPPPPGHLEAGILGAAPIASRPACAQASSRCAPGAPPTPMAPTTSPPISIGNPPPRIRISGFMSRRDCKAGIFAISSANSLVGRRTPVSYTHLRAHETPEHLVCRLLLEKK